MFIAERGDCHHYFQWIVPGGIGDHGNHVLRHVVQVSSLVQGQKMDHYTADVNAQAPQLTQHLAT